MLVVSANRNKVIRVTVYLASEENDQFLPRSWVDGCVKCIGLIVCLTLRTSSHISWRALGRASSEIFEGVRSLFVRNGVAPYNERVGQGCECAVLLLRAGLGGKQGARSKGLIVMKNVCAVSKSEIAKRFGRALQVSVGYGWQKFDWDECEARNGRDVLSDTFWRSLRDELKGECDGVTKSTGVTVNLKRLRAGHGRILWLDIFERIKKSDVLVFDVAAAPDAKMSLKNACDIKDVVTGLNENVLVEIGVALGLGKRVLLLCPEHLLKSIPSDIKGFLWTTYFGKIKDGKFEQKFSDEYGFQGGFMGMLKGVVREELDELRAIHLA